MQNGQIFGSGSPPVKSIQFGSIDLNGATSNTATLPIPVDVNNAVVIHTGNQSAHPAAQDWTKVAAFLTLTNGTTVTAARTTLSAVVFKVGFVVVEFFPGAVKSIQSSSITLDNTTSNTATITAVDTTKSWPINRGTQSDTTFAVTGAQGQEWWEHRIELTNPTTVTGLRGSAIGHLATYGWKVYYTIVEFN